MQDDGTGLAQARAGVDDKIGATTLFTIRHLGFEDGRELFRRHALPRQHAAQLDMRRGGNNDSRVAALPAAAFEKQRHVKYDERRGPVVGKE